MENGFAPKQVMENTNCEGTNKQVMSIETETHSFAFTLH